MDKTLAMKLLDGQGIKYHAVEYPTAERDAAVLAQFFGVPAGQVFKTLVVAHGTKKPLLVLVSAEHQLNLKKLAKAVGVKKVKMATHAEAEKLTSLQVGGISPIILLNKGFDIYADAHIEVWDEVFVSSGQRGINLRVNSAELLTLIDARLVDVV